MWLVCACCIQTSTYCTCGPGHSFLSMGTTLQIVMWVCTEVIQQPTEHERAAAIEFFIRVAEECFRHSDMHCLIMVHSALSSSAVNKLKGSWAHVDRKVRIIRTCVCVCVCVLCVCACVHAFVRVCVHVCA